MINELTCASVNFIPDNNPDVRNIAVGLLTERRSLHGITRNVKWSTIFAHVRAWSLHARPKRSYSLSQVSVWFQSFAPNVTPSPDSRAFLIPCIQAFSLSGHMHSGITIKSFSPPCWPVSLWVITLLHPKLMVNIFSQAVIVASVGILFSATANAPCMHSTFSLTLYYHSHTCRLGCHSWNQRDLEHHRLLPVYRQWWALRAVRSLVCSRTGCVTGRMRIHRRALTHTLLRAYLSYARTCYTELANSSYPSVWCPAEA